MGTIDKDKINFDNPHITMKYSSAVNKLRSGINYTTVDTKFPQICLLPDVDAVYNAVISDDNKLEVCYNQRCFSASPVKINTHKDKIKSSILSVLAHPRWRNCREFLFDISMNCFGVQEGDDWYYVDSLSTARKLQPISKMNVFKASRALTQNKNVDLLYTINNKLRHVNGYYMLPLLFLTACHDIILQLSYNTAKTDVNKPIGKDALYLVVEYIASLCNLPKTANRDNYDALYKHLLNGGLLPATDAKASLYKDVWQLEVATIIEYSSELLYSENELSPKNDDIVETKKLLPPQSKTSVIASNELPAISLSNIQADSKWLGAYANVLDDYFAVGDSAEITVDTELDINDKWRVAQSNVVQMFITTEYTIGVILSGKWSETVLDTLENELSIVLGLPTHCMCVQVEGDKTLL